MANTQYQKILIQMCRHHDKWFYPYEFMGQTDPELFVGYKAPTRLNELEKEYPNLFLRKAEGKFVLRQINKAEFQNWFSKLSKDLKSVVAKELNYYPQRGVK